MMDYYVVRMDVESPGEMEVLFRTNDRQKAGAHFEKLRVLPGTPHAFALIYVIVSKQS